METPEYDYPLGNLHDPDDDIPALEAPRCCACGHEITTVPVIRLFSDRDPDAQWSACNGCIATGRVYTWRWSGQT